MELQHHPLIHELPEYAELIHRLKLEDPEFHDLLEHYHDIDKEIYRIEQEIEPTSDQYLEILKKKRIFLKDKLYQMLREADDQRT